ncbi:hypothetical protein [Flavobacterium sp. ALJ2]|nr:hypothetical protein [Flavobacterium sp. ALJ2]
MSLHYKGLRDGNKTNVPEDYLSNNYETPAFNINRQVVIYLKGV